MHSWTLTAVIAASLLVARPGAGWAQEPSGARPPEAAAEQLIAAGIALRKQGQDAEALAAFEQAYALRPTPRGVAQIALAHQALAHWREAERGLLEVLRGTDDAWVARQRTHLEESLAAVQAHLAWLEVDSNIAGAELWIDGARSGRLPLDGPARIVAGEVNVEVRSPGYASIHHTLHVDAGSQVHAAFAFVAQAAPDVPKKDPPATPAARSPSALRSAGWITLAGAGGLLLVGIGAQITREAEARTYNDDATCGPSGGRSRYQRCGTNRDIGVAAQTVAIVSFAGSAVAAAVSAALLFGGSRPATAPRTGRIGCALAGSALACRVTF